MKKAAMALALLFIFSGCSGKSNIDELISARELPEYEEKVDIQVTDDNGAEQDNVIVIDE